MSLSIKNKIIALCLLSLLGFISIMSVGGNALSDNTEQVNNIDKVYYPIMNSASLNSVLINQLAERFNLAVTIGDDELLEMNKATFDQINRNFQLQQQLQASLKSQISPLQADTKRYFEGAYNVALGMIEEEISLQEAAKQASANNQILERLTASMEEFSLARQSDFESSVSTLEASNVQSKNLMTMFGILALVLIALFSAYVIHGIRKDLTTITDKMRDIAEGDGDLTVRLVHDKKDELKPLVDSFNVFVKNLQENVTQTISNVSNLDTISNTLVTSSRSTSDLSSKQHQAVEEVSNSLHQLFDAARMIAQNANDASESASSASEQAAQGEKQVKSTIAAVQELTEDVRNASIVVQQLDQNTQSAGSILDAISAIAEQTNLLALNAAIEAARAGEQGRGFAVVADEVRTLASRTQTSTQEIQNVLHQLQEQTKTASSIIAESAGKAQECVDKSLVAEQSLQRITSDVAEISQRNEIIASSTEEQERTSSKIEHYVDDIRQMAQGTADSVGELDQVANDINNITRNLSTLTGHFKVS